LRENPWAERSQNTKNEGKDEGREEDPEKKRPGGEKEEDPLISKR